jgi:O-antigen/teichoic acid export membrane protein
MVEKKSIPTLLAWASAEKIGCQLFSFAVFTILARLVEKEAFGMVALVYTYVSLLQLFVSQGIGTSLIRLQDINEEHLNSGFCLNLTCSIAAAGGTIIFSREISLLLGDMRLRPVLSVLSFSLLISALTIAPIAILTRQMSFKPLALRTLLANALGGIGGVILAVFKAGVWSLIVQRLLGEIIGLILLWKCVSWRPRVKVRRQALQDILPISAGLLVNNILWLVVQRFDQGLIGISLGVEALGVYWFARRLVEMPLRDYERTSSEDCSAIVF